MNNISSFIFQYYNIKSLTVIPKKIFQYELVVHLYKNVQMIKRND
jgi:hypothetical protein